MTIDNKLTWTKHISELKKGFANKLNLIKRSPFLPRNSLLDLFLKSFYPRLHMRYQFRGGGGGGRKGVVQIKTLNKNLIIWNLYIVGPLEPYIISLATCPLRM